MWGPLWTAVQISAICGPLHALQGHTCFTMVSSRRNSSPAPGTQTQTQTRPRARAPPLLLPHTSVSAGQFLTSSVSLTPSISLTPLSHTAVVYFYPFLNMLSEMHHRWWTHLRPAVGPLELAGGSCIWHGQLLPSSHRGCPCSAPATNTLTPTPDITQGKSPWHPNGGWSRGFLESHCYLSPHNFLELPVSEACSIFASVC